MIRGVCDSGQKAGLCKAKFKGAEFAREELNNAGDLRWGDEQAVNAMDNTVRSKLGRVSIRLSIGAGKRTMSMATMRL